MKLSTEHREAISAAKRRQYERQRELTQTAIHALSALGDVRAALDYCAEHHPDKGFARFGLNHVHTVLGKLSPSTLEHLRALGVPVPDGLP